MMKTIIERKLFWYNDENTLFLFMINLMLY